MVRRVINLVYREVKGLHQAAYILALFAFGSQILAVVRDRLLAHTFGAGAELDLYYAAFRVPDLLFVLFASVLSVYVLLPFVDREQGVCQEDGKQSVLSQMFTLFLYAYMLVAAVLVLLAPWYMPWLFPGFAGQYQSLTILTQILLLQPFLLGLSSLCGVITQMHHRFILHALSPLLYNIGIIFGIVFLYQYLGLVGLVLGVVIGALGHVLIQIPFITQSKYSFHFTKKFDWKLIGQVLSVSVPRALTLSVNQIVLLILTGMASLMAAGSVSVFQFAFNLQSVPLAVIGMSYSVAAFPTLSRLFAANDQAGFKRQLLTALRHIIFWSVPIIGLVVVLRAHIVRVLLGSGEFDWSDTRLTAAVLAIFVVSLVAQAILLLLVRSFYAGGRTLIPLVVSLGSGAVSVILAWQLHGLFVAHPTLAGNIESTLRLTAVGGAEVLVLAVAFVCGQFLQLAVLLGISTKTFSISYRPLLRLVAEATAAMLAGAIVAYMALIMLVDGINQETFIGIALQGLIAGIIGLSTIVFVYWSFGSREFHEVVSSLRIKILKTDVIAPQEE